MKKEKRLAELLPAGELIVYDGSKCHNHGCKDFAIIKSQGDGSGVVIEGTSCHDCWQVGHDENRVFHQKGDVIDLTDMVVVRTTVWGEARWEVDGWLPY